MTPITSPDFAPRVRRGAELLDRVRPGWERAIHRTTLDVRYPCDCPVGQTFGSYTDGLEALSAPLPRQTITRTWAVDHGFGLLRAEQSPKNWRALTDAWRALVRERLGREAQS